MSLRATEWFELPEGYSSLHILALGLGAMDVCAAVSTK